MKKETNTQMTNNEPENGTQLDELTPKAAPTILESALAMKLVEYTFTLSFTKLIQFDQSFIRANCYVQA